MATWLMVNSWFIDGEWDDPAVPMDGAAVDAG